MRGPIVITGGGTGGHIFPMEAVADQLRTRGVDVRDLRFVGSRRGQESTLLAAHDVALTVLPGRGFRRALAPDAMVQNLGAAVSLFAAVVEAIVKVRRWRPSVVVSLGGYASFATSLAAVLWRRPLVWWNSTPNRCRPATLHTIRACAVLRLPLERRASAVVTGTPLRERIVTVDRSPGCAGGRAPSDRPADRERAPGRGRDDRFARFDDGERRGERTRAAMVDAPRPHDHPRDGTTRRRRSCARERRRTDGLDYRILEFGDMSRTLGARVTWRSVAPAPPRWPS